MTKIAYDTYAALLRLFIHYMSRVRHRVDQPPMNHMIDNEGIERNQFHGLFYFKICKTKNYVHTYYFIGTELINVRWYSGPNAPNVAPQVQSVATVHFFIVHAQVCIVSK